MDSQKILVCGFPHCGTSILKSVIGHMEDVEEIVRETCSITKKSDKKFIVCKNPFTNDKFFDESYDDYKIIFIVRNPLFVFSSLNKRCSGVIPRDHSIDKYVKTLEKFIHYRTNPKENVYTIRYEDLFENDYTELKKIFDDIGFQYDDSIFDNSKYTNAIIPGIKLVDKMPACTEHSRYRTWQINQPFISNNDVSKLDLSEEQKKKIVNNPVILQVYPDVKNLC